MSSSESEPLLPPSRKKRLDSLLRIPRRSSNNRNSLSEAGPTDLEDDEGDLSDEIFQDKEWMRIENLSWLKKPTVLKIGIIMLLVELALGIAAPLEQIVYYKLACQYVKHKTPGEGCNPVEVQRIVTNFVMWNEIIASGVLVATSAKICLLLDIYGRKTFLVLFAAALVVGKTVIYVAMSTSHSMPAGWMWFGLMVSLMFGGIQGLSSLFKAYIADISQPQNRISNIGFAMVFSNIGTLGGPALLGLLLTLSRKLDLGRSRNSIPRPEFVPIEAGLALLVTLVLLCLFMLPESRSRKAERASEIEQEQELEIQQKKGNLTLEDHIRSYFFPLRILTFPEEFKNRRNRMHFGRVQGAVHCLVVVNCLLLLVLETVVTISKQYSIYKYGWDAVMLSKNLILNGVCNMLVYLVVSPVLVHRILPYLGVKSSRYLLDEIDTTVLLACSLTNFTAVFGRAFAPNTSTFLILCVLDSFSVLSVPTLAACVIKFYPSSKTGEVYGALSLAQSVIALIFPPTLSQLFTVGVRIGFPGLPYVVVSLVCLASAGTILRARTLVNGCVVEQ